MSQLTVEAECKWVDEHPHFYANDEHREDVKHNIRTLDQIRELDVRIAEHEQQVKVLRGTLRKTHSPEYCTIKVPPIPPTKDELQG